MKKKNMAWALIFCLLLALAAGCSNTPSPQGTQATTAPPTSASPSSAPTSAASSAPQTQDTASSYGDTGGLVLPLVSQPVEVTWMTAHDNIDWTNTPFAAELEKRTGVRLLIENVPQDALNEKINTALASRNLPNLMNAGVARANLYGEQGAFIALNEHLDAIPNFKKIIYDTPENDWYHKAYATESGSLYTWPILDLSRDVNHMYMVRRDVLDRHGLHVWAAGDTQAFYDTLKQLKALYPDSLPMTSKMGSNIWFYQAAGWGFPQIGFPMRYLESESTWEYGLTSPDFKSMLDFYKKLYEEGLLDPEFLTNTSASWVSKMASPETSFVTFDWISRLDIFYEQVKNEIPDYNLEAAPPIGPTGKTYQLPRLGNMGTAISAITPNHEAALGLIDYLFSPSGATLNSIGAEDEWFHFDENGVPVYTDPELAAMEKIEIDALSGKYGIWNQSMYVRVDRRSLYHKLTEKEQYANDIITRDHLFLTPSPVLSFSDEVLDNNSQLITDLNTKGYEAAMNYIISPSFGDAGWQAWLDHAKSIGADTLVANYNEAQKLYDAR